MDGTFAFIIHPLDISYVSYFEPKAKGKSPALIKKILEWSPSFKVSEITGVKSITGKEISGWLIGCTLLPEQMITLDIEVVLKKIIQAGEIGQELGAKIVGLGAYTSVVGDAGITVSNNLDVAVTSGSSYTISSSLEGVKKAAEILEVDISSSKVSVIGATGAIGRVCSEILSKEVPHLILVGRNEERVNKLVNHLKEKSSSHIEGSINVKESAKKSEIIITATSNPSALIGPDDLLPGAIVCDASRPRNVSEEVVKLRDDVFVFDGGLIEVPGDNVDFHFNFGFPPKLAYACMSETMILALEERYENFSLGREINFEKAEEINKLAKKHGFKLAGFRSFDKPVSDEDIQRIKQKRRKK